MFVFHFQRGWCPEESYFVFGYSALLSWLSEDVLSIYMMLGYFMVGLWGWHQHGKEREALQSAQAIEMQALGS